MRVSGLLVSLALVSASALSAVPALAGEAHVAVVGKPVYSSDKRNLGTVYLVNLDGSAKVFVNSRLVTIPASTLSLEKGRIVTSMTKKDVLAKR